MHLAVGVSSLLGELVPGFGLAEQLGHGSLGQTEHVLGEQPLPDVVDGEEFPHPARDVQRVQVLRGVLVHVVTQHLLETRLHGVTFGDERLSQPTHGAVVAEPEGAARVVEAEGALHVIVAASASAEIERRPRGAGCAHGGRRWRRDRHSFFGWRPGWRVAAVQQLLLEVVSWRVGRGGASYG